MPVLQLNDRRHQLKPGQTRLGGGGDVDVPISGDEQLGLQAVVDVGTDGRVVIRRSGEHANVRVNGVALGVEPTPLLHGDKVEIAGYELLFAEEAKVGATQFVTSNDVAGIVQQRRAGARRATAATGGRLVSLVDGKEYVVPAEGVVIGRDASCDVVVAQNDVSRQHAQIVAEERGYVIRDQSANGVFVNGERVKERSVLARADVVRIGTEEFRFYADVAEAPQRAPEAVPEPVPASASAVGRSAVTAPPPAVAPPPPPPPPPPAPIAPASAPASPRADRPAVTAPASTGGPDTRPLLATLEIINEGVDKGKRLEIRTPLANVGRGSHNDVVLSSDSVSDAHAKLTQRADGWYIADVGSTNGTWLAGSRVTSECRIDGTPDVRFGGVKVIFRAQGTPAELPKGTRAIASVPVDRAAARAVDAASAAQPAARRTSPWVWVLILAAVVVVAFLLINR